MCQVYFMGLSWRFSESELKWLINPSGIIEAFPDTLWRLEIFPVSHCLPGIVKEMRPREPVIMTSEEELASLAIII